MIIFLCLKIIEIIIFEFKKRKMKAISLLYFACLCKLSKIFKIMSEFFNHFSYLSDFSDFGRKVKR